MWIATMVALIRWTKTDRNLWHTIVLFYTVYFGHFSLKSKSLSDFIVQSPEKEDSKIPGREFSIWNIILDLFMFVKIGHIRLCVMRKFWHSNKNGEAHFHSWWQNSKKREREKNHEIIRQMRFQTKTKELREKGRERTSWAMKFQ